ncbi:MAG: hypothetical protein A2Z91_01125 [Deltaproteobacteria bacterium GWA2_38_16]|nr:MAG: hypothetical protein A2Z91_01125 [Deltaproteobacteria bacterium GWA2_38_16]OGQ02956.1 MAG: hypothetical protein A3D19_00905 [Deltaproteobacteria bacterium RIFCSPHIGHO2_02_FULL_38_15]OGQ34499.1 MAG: hypothetical protein A3A72_05045 [Deltaproteobacteria bacterium RIFCSPLOWO2_01_FULL_38_9]
MKKWALPVLSILILGFLVYSLPFIHTTQSANSHKVILISFDGFANQNLHKFLDEELFGTQGLGKIKKEGTLANSMQVTLPSLTATSHISLITGTSPEHTGIVSNNFHKTLDPIGQSTNGFEEKLESDTQTLWEILRAQGKKVGVIAYPAADWTDERRSADWGMAYNQSEAPSSIQQFTKSQFTPYTRPLPQDIRSYSLPQEGTFYLLESPNSVDYDSTIIHHHSPKKNKAGQNFVQRPFKIVALDTTDDNTSNYDTLIVDNDALLSNGYMGKVTSDSPWIAVSFKSNGILKGSWCQLISLSPNLSSLVWYTGVVSYTKAYPKSFQELMDKEVGFWPGAPDRSNEFLTEEMVLEQAIRFSEFLKNATLTAAKNQPWDAILTYQPILDELGHSFSMVNPKQKDYSESKSQLFLDIIRRGHMQANSVIHSLITQNPSSNLVIVSDHGMEPLHTVYYPNRLLMKRGFLDKVSVTARAFSSGGCGHVYINLSGREPNGTVPKEKFEKIKQDLVKLFKQEEAVSQILIREESSAVGLNHANSGDLILVGKPGYHFNDSTVEGELMEPASFYGQHGYDPTLPSMKAIFAAWGPQVKHEALGDISYTYVLPFVLNLLK